MKNIVVLILDPRSSFKSGNQVPWVYPFSKN
jgi:hypothetical protein